MQRPQKNPQSCPHKTHVWTPSTAMDSKEHRLRKRASVSLLEIHLSFYPQEAPSPGGGGGGGDGGLGRPNRRKNR